VLATSPALFEAGGEQFLGYGTARAGRVTPGDHLQTIYNLWLPGHQLADGRAPWLDPYSFQPEAPKRTNYAGWPFSIVFWPLHALFGTVGAWNAFALLSYLGAGAAAAAWLRSLRLPLGAALVADVHWYPGGMQLRALVGSVHEGPSSVPEVPVALTVEAALDAVGWAVVAEPWLERFPVCIDAVPVRGPSGGWMLADATGGMPIVSGLARLPELVAVAGGHPVRIVGEWSIDGVLPLVAWVDDRAVRL